MKKITSILVPLIFYLSTFNATAQSVGIHGANLQLRALFGNLSLPPNPKLFLYDMACHVTDSTYFQGNCPKILPNPTWFALYDEMYNSAYDTTLFLPPLDLFNSSQQFGTDTIPMGIMNYDFYKFKHDALNTNLYFNFNVSTNTLSDKSPRPSWPYLDSAIFASAPLVGESFFSDPVFRIDPDYILYDVHNASHFENPLELVIDFGDGKGWVQFDPAKISHHQVNYNKSGDKIIVTQIRNAYTQAIIHSSTSKLSVKNSQKIVLPNSSMNVPGLNVGIYSGCNSNGLSSGKVIIYLPGFDVLDLIPSKRRSIPRIYHEMISNNRIVQLKNQGYSFLVVDYKRSTIDMRFNALYLVNLLEKIKCDLDYAHQFVIMGESMGGLIARYAMTYMESPQYDNQDTAPFFVDALDDNNQTYLSNNPDIFNLPNQWCMTDKSHNTRLLITLDAPHQGANLPLSFQHAYESGMNAFHRVAKFDLRRITKMMNLFIDGQAAQQMLIYHVDTKNGSSYSSHEDKVSFFNQLADLGDYPQYCKVTALSNGSLAGEKQTNFYTSTDRTPGDNLLDFDGEIFCYILGRKFKVMHAELLAKTNSSTNALIYKAYAYLNTPVFNIYLFGIQIGLSKLTLINDQAHSNALPYCVNSGGYTGDPLFIGANVNSSNHNTHNSWFLNVFHHNYVSTGNGCIGFDSHAGWNGFLSVNLDFSVCSDGLHFTIVPTQSALDYGVLGNYPLDHDIENENINTKLNRVKPDVIIGYPDPGYYINRNHLGDDFNSFRNPKIFNITQQPAVNKDHTYFSCVNYNDKVERGLINLEIGDEELYLDNAILNWSSFYQSEYDVLINSPNPYLEYSSSPLSSLKVDGAYSKDEPFEITNLGQAIFITDPLNSPTKKGLSYNPPFTGPYYRKDSSLNICCIDFLNGRVKEISKNEYQENLGSKLVVFPNPSNGSWLSLRFTLKHKGNVKVSIYDITGKLIIQKPLGFIQADLERTSSISIKRALPAGTYLLRLSTDQEDLNTIINITRD